MLVVNPRRQRRRQRHGAVDSATVATHHIAMSAHAIVDVISNPDDICATLFLFFGAARRELIRLGEMARFQLPTRLMLRGLHLVVRYVVDEMARLATSTDSVFIFDRFDPAHNVVAFCRRHDDGRCRRRRRRDDDVGQRQCAGQGDERWRGARDVCDDARRRLASARALALSLSAPGWGSVLIGSNPL